MAWADGAWSELPWAGEPAGGGSTITAAAGVATTSALAGKSAAAAAITGASGAATASPITGKSTARAAITQADGVATASTLVGSGAAAGTASISPAAGVATTSALAGKSTAVAAIVAAAGVATTSTLVDANAPTATTTRRHAGGYKLRKGYIIKGRRYFLTDDELAVHIAHMLTEVSRGDIKEITSGKPKPISRKVWDVIKPMERLNALSDRMNATELIADDDDEETMLIFM